MRNDLHHEFQTIDCLKLLWDFTNYILFFLAASSKSLTAQKEALVAKGSRGEGNEPRESRKRKADDHDHSSSSQVPTSTTDYLFLSK